MRPPRLDLDFVTRADRGRRARWLLFVVGAVIALDVGRNALVLREDVARLSRHEAARGEARTAAPGIRPVDAALSSAGFRDEWVLAHEVVRRIATPWEDLFAALDESKTSGISLLSIEPDPAAGTVTIAGEARDYLAILSYVSALSATGRLAEAHLQKHEPRTEPRGRTLGFQIVARWKMDTR